MPTFEPFTIPSPIWLGWATNRPRKAGPCSKRWHDTWKKTISGGRVADGIEKKIEKKKDEGSR